MPFAKTCECVDGVRRLWHPEFNVAHLKTRVVVNSFNHHIKPVMILQKTFLFFQRIMWRNDKPNFMQISKFNHIIGQHHMTVMNRIEGSEKKTYTLGYHVLKC